LHLEYLKNTIFGGNTNVYHSDGIDWRWQSRPTDCFTQRVFPVSPTIGEIFRALGIVLLLLEP
jgi:hypothetical protein